MTYKTGEFANESPSNAPDTTPDSVSNAVPNAVAKVIGGLYLFTQRAVNAGGRLGLLALVALLLAACGGFGGEQPTRTPVPTFTMTPEGQSPAVVEPEIEPAVTVAPPAPAANAPQPVAQEPTPVPTDTPLPSPTEEPTAIPEPTATPTPTVVPTDTPVPTPTPTPNYLFDLESAEKFPTQGLATDVVRVYLYIYSPAEFGLADYTIAVTHNGASLDVDQVSAGGLPQQTRSEPGPYTRFYNFSAIFVESQAGEWTVRLVDSAGQVVGPPAEFQLSADENTRELYVRYRQQ